jgi:hypothetical protein
MSEMELILKITNNDTLVFDRDKIRVYLNILKIINDAGFILVKK